MPDLTDQAAPAGRSRRATMLRWTAILLMLASLGANLLMLRGLQDSFARLHFARIFPLGYVGPDGSAATSGPAASGSVAFWGDSRSHGWGRQAATPRAATLNFAHGSQTSGQTLLQLQTRPVTRADVAVLQVGINDLHPLGALGPEKTLALQQLRRNLVAIRDLLLERHGLVVLTTIFPPGPVPLQRRPQWDPETLNRIDEINALIRSAADGRRVVVLDAHALLADPRGLLAPAYADDDFFLHVNAAAYARLDAALAQLLARHLPPRS